MKNKLTARSKKLFSPSPDGEEFPLPSLQDHKTEFSRIEKLATIQRKQGKEIVVVNGLGFVGLVMAAVVADSVDERGNANKFVIGMQRPSVRSFWKIPTINRGLSPIRSEDPEVDVLLKRCVLQRKNMIATFAYDVLKLADVVIVDIQCDYLKDKLGNAESGHADMKTFEEAIDIIADYINPDCLVIIETTVAPGTTEQVAYPIIKKRFEKRGINSEPLLAHSYERVMPGKEYVRSIRDFWRVCSGINEESKRRVEKFLSEVIHTKDFPLTVLDKPIESETAKIIENSYRATILAFMDEWSIFAERNGIDLKKVIAAIKVRPTHSNIMFPGPGVGGYCLPKDGGLGVWSYKHIFGWEDNIFKITPMVININDTRALHAAQLVRDALRNMGKPIAAADILLLGASYREDIGDTRYSGSELIVRRLTEMGADVKVHDPYVDHWWELEKQDEYPRPDYSQKRFFDRQDKLSELRIEKDMWTSMSNVDAIVLAVKHQQYMNLDPEEVVRSVGKPCAIIDCFAILNDDQIRKYLELGCEVKGMGRGHIQRIKKSIMKEG
jgi:UDP-N-acetyl-D-glucosamine dehydrogenase